MVMLNDQQILADIHALPEEKQAEVLDFIAKLKASKKERRKHPLWGAIPNLVIHMAEDFDEPLEEFAEYMS